MRKSVIVLAAAAAVLVAESLLSSPVQAMPLNGAASVRLAGDAINSVETVACWRNGSRGWAWYSYCGGGVYGGVGPGWRGGYRWRGHSSWHSGGRARAEWHSGGRRGGGAHAGGHGRRGGGGHAHHGGGGRHGGGGHHR